MTVYLRAAVRLHNHPKIWVNDALRLSDCSLAESDLFFHMFPSWPAMNNKHAVIALLLMHWICEDSYAEFNRAYHSLVH